MRKFLFLVTFLQLMFFANINVLANSFVSGIEDIPLMNGLNQVQSDIIFFGNEETRYIEIELNTDSGLSFEDIKGFYTKTLPQLGWNIKESNKLNILFNREKDILELKTSTHNPLKILLILKNNN